MVAAKKDAISLLTADHRKVEALFEKYETARGKKAEIAQKICMELVIHTLLEEEIFYPACRQGGAESDLMDEANVEHDGAKVLIAELQQGAPEDEFYDAKVKVLSEEIKHHVKEEEKRGGVFTEARKAKLDLEELGRKMLARKKELVAQFEKSGPPKPITLTMTASPPEQGNASQ
jgi:hypothetical protein